MKGRNRRRKREISTRRPGVAARPTGGREGRHPAGKRKREPARGRDGRAAVRVGQEGRYRGRMRASSSCASSSRAAERAGAEGWQAAAATGGGVDAEGGRRGRRRETARRGAGGAAPGGGGPAGDAREGGRGPAAWEGEGRGGEAADAAAAGLVLWEHGVVVGLALGGVGRGDRVDNGLCFFVADFYTDGRYTMISITSRTGILDV